MLLSTVTASDTVVVELMVSIFQFKLGLNGLGVFLRHDLAGGWSVVTDGLILSFVLVAHSLFCLRLMSLQNMTRLFELQDYVIPRGQPVDYAEVEE
jgi:hypothetical protein